MATTIDEGVGFPSCCRDLDLVAPTRNDPNGFYDYLDLPPDASIAEVRRRCKRLLRKYHPDGWKPNRAKFERVEEIYRVLGDEQEKSWYDHTPEGLLYLNDSELKGDIVGDSTTIDDLEERVRERVVSLPQHYTYFNATSPHDSDRALAQEWYRVLIPLAYDLGHRTTLRVVLTDETILKGLFGEEVFVPKETPTITAAIDILTAAPVSA